MVIFIYIYDTNPWHWNFPDYTFNPISSANGRTNKSPTADTVAFPDNNDFDV
jgi:hypothetical protein